MVSYRRNRVPGIGHTFHYSSRSSQGTAALIHLGLLVHHGIFSTSMLLQFGQLEDVLFGTDEKLATSVGLENNLKQLAGWLDNLSTEEARQRWGFQLDL